MAETEAVAAKLGIELPISIDQRMAGAEKVGAHKTSMLQDYEAGRPMELEAVVGGVIELGERLGVPMPATRAVYACTKLLDEHRGQQRSRAANRRGGTVNVNNRWFQLGASLIAMIMIANLQYAWTLFVQPLQAGTGWRLSDIQFAFTLFILFQTWVQPLDGWLIDRLGPRGFISAAGLLCGLGWAGLGYATSLPMLYALYCAAGIGAAFVYSGSIGSALKWFKDRRGLASGIMAAGFGGGTALFIPFISSTIASSGYQTAFIATGLFQGLVIVVVAQFLRHPPPEPATAAKARGRGASQVGRRHFTTLEMLRTPQFYVMYAMFVLMATGGLLVTANAGPMARSWGLTAGGADARRDAQPAGQRRQPDLLGLGVGSHRPRNHDDRRLRAAGGLPVAGRRARPALRRLVRVHARARLLHVGRDLFALPVHGGRLLRHALCHVELRRPLHGQGRGVDHRRLVWRAALRTVRQLVGGLLRKRGDGARGCGPRRRPACVDRARVAPPSASPPSPSSRQVGRVLSDPARSSMTVTDQERSPRS